MRHRMSIGYRDLAFAALLALPLTAAASGANWQGWSKMHEHLVSARQALRGEVSNGLNPIGDVADLVLAPDHHHVQYVLYRATYPYTNLDSTEDGFVSFDHVKVEEGAGLRPDLLLDHAESAQTPDELKLTARQAADRLVSRIIGKQLYFSDGNSRRITDMLLDRKTGEVMQYVIEKNPGSVFDSDPLAVPADKVTIAESRVSTSVGLATLPALQKISPAYL